MQLFCWFGVYIDMRRDIAIKIEPTDRDFDYWLSRSYVDDDLKALLSNANVLIVPREDYPGFNGPIFPQGTDQLLEFLKENSPAGIVPEACISDGDYDDLTLHHDLFDLGIFVVQDLVAPVIAGLIVKYANLRRTNKPDIKVTFIVVDPEAPTKQITYEGPADQLAYTVSEAVKVGDAKQKLIVHPSPKPQQLAHEHQSNKEVPTRSSK